MSNDIQAPNVYDTFQKVLGFLGLWARSALVADSTVTYVSLWADDAMTLVPHPFVCEQGYVRADVAPPLEVVAMVHDVTHCPTHSYAADRHGAATACRMHPVVDSGQLAAWALGGEAAVRTKQTPGRRYGFDKGVYAAWVGMTESFQQAVCDHDKQIAEENVQRAVGGRLLHVANNAKLPAVAGPVPVGAVTIKIRPQERRRKKRR